MADLKSTPRNALLGLLADAAQGTSNFVSQPFGYANPPGEMLMQALGVPALAKTFDTASYGGGLTRGTGYARQMLPDTAEALLSVLPGGAGAKSAAPVAKQAAKVAAKELSPQAEKLLMDFMVKQGGIKPITAYHGSPHKFDNFSLEKIGTGEGAQVYGHGLYFADSPDVAKDYMRELFTGKGDSPKAMAQLLMAPKEVGGLGLRPGEAQDVLWDRLSSAQRAGGGKLGSQFSNRILEAIKYTQGDVNTGANFYKVDIPDEAVANMLLWDKPLSEQPESVRNALQKAISLMPEERQQLFREYPLQDFQQGKDIKEMIGERLLKQAGIPGIRYLDQGSRDAGQGTMNTVLFDDSLVKILERNGVPMQGLLGN